MVSSGIQFPSGRQSLFWLKITIFLDKTREKDREREREREREMEGERERERDGCRGFSSERSFLREDRGRSKAGSSEWFLLASRAFPIESLALKRKNMDRSWCTTAAPLARGRKSNKITTKMTRARPRQLLASLAKP